MNQKRRRTLEAIFDDPRYHEIQAKAVCGYVPDEPDLYAKLSGRELLRFVGDLYDLDRPHIARRIDEPRPSLVALEASFARGRIVHDGLSLALVGSSIPTDSVSCSRLARPSSA